MMTSSAFSLPSTAMPRSRRVASRDLSLSAELQLAHRLHRCPRQPLVTPTLGTFRPRKLATTMALPVRSSFHRPLPPLPPLRGGPSTLTSSPWPACEAMWPCSSGKPLLPPLLLGAAMEMLRPFLQGSCRGASLFGVPSEGQTQGIRLIRSLIQYNRRRRPEGTRPRSRSPRSTSCTIVSYGVAACMRTNGAAEWRHPHRWLRAL